MVCCKKCKYFIEENIEDVFVGICNAPNEYGGYFDFLEDWQIDSGECELYDSVDGNRTNQE